MCLLSPSRFPRGAVAVASLLLASGFVALRGAEPDTTSRSIYHADWIDLNKNGVRDPYEDSRRSIDERVNDLLARMTMEEKTCQLVTLYGYCRVLSDPQPTEQWKQRVWKDGIGNIDEHLNNSIRCIAKGATREYSFPYDANAAGLNETQRFFIEETRLGIPADFTNEGLRGLCSDSATLLPAAIGIGSTWNTELVRAIGGMVGAEAYALGYTNIYAPILDLPRDPRWGRIVECYGEDPFLVSSYGRQMVLGLQEQGVASTLKHFAVYGIPRGGRDGNARTDPQVTPREMVDLHLEPFRVAVQEAGALGVMASYNDWNGAPVATSAHFLTDILRDEFGFRGYVVSDSDAVEYPFSKHRTAAHYREAIRQCLEAGLNIRTNFTAPEKFVEPLREAIALGEIAPSLIDQRVAEVLRVKFVLGLFDQPYRDPANANTVVRSPEHLAIARQASRESLVLLKNDGLLPIDPSALRRVLVVGPNADDGEGSISRYGPSNVDVVTVYEGIKAHLGSAVEVVHARGSEIVDATWPESEILPTPLTSTEESMISEAVEEARQSDLAVVVLGDSERTVGESVSRTSLELPGRQLQLLQAIEATGTPVVLVLVSGRPLSINWADRHVPAIVEAWFPGEFGGDAIAELLTGTLNPGGRLPVTFPKTVGQVPIAFPSKPAANAGQPKSGPNGTGFSRVTGALYPFGHGLSYTTFDYGPLELSASTLDLSDDLELSVSLEVTNSGERAGDEVVQLYLRDEVSTVTTYDQMLRGFARITLAPGETRRVTFTLSWRDLSLLDDNLQRMVEPGVFRLMVGASSEDIRSEAEFTVATANLEDNG
ncbi:glycoside hydrolase family 3 N-terminal domain-containing protein [Actomonas aquatica]|uniref:Glycoside hydrolase family 3 N-terminal domain-containing protein n=1 Tax=Actomonas aquatica TaxID=2866162 RepID=A0ABZ1C5C6_9BACT|nr:glycoside hydrolase family 3 N-terminal domain-containing protein [Opitutus sp. WL0086]WRQ86721.1 glycoside hydrolase family 3 N-terminal domain-containing protein [Opitutus sp. WL0086]